MGRRRKFPTQRSAPRSTWTRRLDNWIKRNKGQLATMVAEKGMDVAIAYILQQPWLIGIPVNEATKIIIRNLRKFSKTPYIA